LFAIALEGLPDLDPDIPIVLADVSLCASDRLRYQTRFNRGAYHPTSDFVGGI
jgi:hypothetical protein